MPASILVTAEQIKAIWEEIVEPTGHAVIIEEQSQTDNVVDIWVLDPAHQSTRVHRSVLLDHEGNVLADSEQPDQP